MTQRYFIKTRYRDNNKVKRVCLQIENQKVYQYYYYENYSLFKLYVSKIIK